MLSGWNRKIKEGEEGKLPRYTRRNWNPTYRDAYSRFSGKPNRLYGERGYNDKHKIETSSLPKQIEPKYDIELFKPYRYPLPRIQIDWNPEEKVESGSEEKIEADLEKKQKAEVEENEENFK